MAHGRKSRSHDVEPAHPLETLIRLVSEDAVDDDLDVRADRWAQQVRRDVDAKLARLRQQLEPARSSHRRASRPSADLRALDRAGLLARLAVLQQNPDVRIAHHELEGLTTEDLRLLVAELEATARTQEVTS